MSKIKTEYIPAEHWFKLGLARMECLWLEVCNGSVSDSSESSSDSSDSSEFSTSSWDEAIKKGENN